MPAEVAKPVVKIAVIVNQFIYIQLGETEQPGGFQPYRAALMIPKSPKESNA
jgi:hypothetical protein